MPPGFTGGTASAITAINRPRAPPKTDFAVDAMVRIIEANPGIELITLGPLTNLALALRQSPQLAANVSRCVVMGGAPCCEGNVTPAAEYNFWVDPEAARVVLRSQLPIELVGWQLSRGAAVVNGQEIEDILALRTSFAEFAIRSNDTAAQAYRTQTGEEGIALPDPTAMAILLDPALALVSSDHYMDVQVDSGITRGMSVVDRLGVAAGCKKPRRLERRCGAGTQAHRHLGDGYSRLEAGPAAGARVETASHLRHRPLAGRRRGLPGRHCVARGARSPGHHHRSRQRSASS